MKKTFRNQLLIGAAFLLLAVLAVLLFLLPATEEGETLAPQEARVPEAVEGATLSIITDPALVFQRAFWRRPGTEDKVLHAERLEWTNDSGDVVKWQWFLVVEPGASTQAWLAENPFGLPPGSGERDFNDEAYRPEWFPASEELREHQVLESANGRHQLATSADGKRLYGTDSGFGFAQPERSIAPRG